MDLFVRQPGRVFHGLAQVVRLEVRVVSQDFLSRRTVSHLPNDNGDWNAHASDTGSSAKDLGIESDTVERDYFQENASQLRAKRATWVGS
jgi:hypothetical protein